MPKPPAPTATSPFVDVFKAMAWEWRDLAEQRDVLLAKYHLAPAAVLEEEIDRLDEAHSEHPFRGVCRRLEELSGIPRSDWEDGGWWVNSGYALMDLVPGRRGPAGRGEPHLLHPGDRRVPGPVDEGDAVARLRREAGRDRAELGRKVLVQEQHVHRSRFTKVGIQ